MTIHGIPTDDAHAPCVAHNSFGAAVGSPFGGEDHIWRGDHCAPVPPPNLMPADDAHGKRVAQAADSASAGIPDIVDAIVARHRERNYWMEHRKRNMNSLGDQLRRQMGWSLAEPPAVRKAIEQRATEIVTLGQRYLRDAARVAKKAGGGEDHGGGGNHLRSVPLPPAVAPYAEIVLTTLMLGERPLAIEETHAAEMERLAQQLPVWERVKDWPQFGPLALAIIVAEAAGEHSLGLGDFPTKGKLFKRLGLAVIDGVRQGGLRKGVPKKEWERHGYSRIRRSRVWTATTWLVVKNPRYRALYLARKEYETLRAEAEGLKIAPAAKVPKARAAEYRTLGHIDHRARRFAEKHFLCDLWRAWAA